MSLGCPIIAVVPKLELTQARTQGGGSYKPPHWPALCMYHTIKCHMTADTAQPRKHSLFARPFPRERAGSGDETRRIVLCAHKNISASYFEIIFKPIQKILHQQLLCSLRVKIAW